MQTPPACSTLLSTAQPWGKNTFSLRVNYHEVFGNGPGENRGCSLNLQGNAQPLGKNTLTLAGKYQPVQLLDGSNLERNIRSLGAIPSNLQRNYHNWKPTICSSSNIEPKIRSLRLIPSNIEPNYQ
jgi:hypothetical protein